MKKGIIYILGLTLIVINVTMTFTNDSSSKFNLTTLISTALASDESGDEECITMYTDNLFSDIEICYPSGCYEGTMSGTDVCEGDYGMCESKGFWIEVYSCGNPCTSVGCPADPGPCD